MEFNRRKLFLPLVLLGMGVWGVQGLAEEPKMPAEIAAQIAQDRAEVEAQRAVDEAEARERMEQDEAEARERMEADEAKARARMQEAREASETEQP